jgi:hypothetical protein
LLELISTRHISLSYPREIQLYVLVIMAMLNHDDE